jgi:hypothetical protein
MSGIIFRSSGFVIKKSSGREFYVQLHDEQEVIYHGFSGLSGNQKIPLHWLCSVLTRRTIVSSIIGKTIIFEDLKKFSHGARWSYSSVSGV